MLVVKMKEDEYLMIGDSIKVMITTGTGSTKLGIKAPKDVLILRGDLYEKAMDKDSE